MTNTQDIFKDLGPNWKWASISRGGSANVYAKGPWFTSTNQDPRPRKGGTSEDYRPAPMFNVAVPPEGIEPCVWERTDFANGPTYDTDKFGRPLMANYDAASLPISVEKCADDTCNSPVMFGAKWCEYHQQQHDVAVAPPSLPEGWLDCYNAKPILDPGAVVDLIFPSGRIAYNISVAGADWGEAVGYKLVNEQCTAKDLHPGYEAEQDLRIAQLEKLLKKYRKAGKELEAAKDRARYLGRSYDEQTGASHLSPVQYMAIFGEQLPK